MGDLDQWIGDIGVGGEHGAAQSAAGIDRVSNRGIDFLHVMARAANSNAGRIGVDANDLVSAGEVARHPRMNFHFPTQPRIE